MTEKRSYTTEFKIQAVKSVLEGGESLAKVAARLGVSKGGLEHWKRLYQGGRLDPNFKQARPTPIEEELRQLRSENKRLSEEVAILKKAAASWAERHLPGLPASFARSLTLLAKWRGRFAVS